MGAGSGKSERLFYLRFNFRPYSVQFPGRKKPPRQKIIAQQYQRILFHPDVYFLRGTDIGMLPLDIVIRADTNSWESDSGSWDKQIFRFV